MTDIFEMILSELRDAGCAHVERFPKFYNCSIGSHLLNLHNKRNHVYFLGRRIPDLRNHIMFVAPPGCEKTWWLEQYLRGAQAILTNSGIDCVMKGAMSEAGFVGTKRFNSGTTQEVPGICRTHNTAIVGIEEFSAVTAMMSTEHSSTLDPALLGSLDSGFVYKDLAAGSISYETFLTLWAASQPARFDLRSGMARRFIFIYFVPTQKDLDEIKRARRDAKNKRFNPIRTDRIRKELRKLKSDIQRIEKITFDPEVYRLYDQNKFLHWEEQLYDHLLMGYQVMRGRFDRELYVTLDDMSQRILLEEAHYRDTLRRGSEYAEVLLLLREHGGEMGLFQLKDELLAFGLDWRQSRDLISDMLRIHAIRQTSDNRILLAKELRER